MFGSLARGIAARARADLGHDLSAEPARVVMPLLFLGATRSPHVIDGGALVGVPSKRMLECSGLQDDSVRGGVGRLCDATDFADVQDSRLISRNSQGSPGRESAMWLVCSARCTPSSDSNPLALHVYSICLRFFRSSCCDTTVRHALARGYVLNLNPRRGLFALLELELLTCSSIHASIHSFSYCSRAR